MKNKRALAGFALIAVIGIVLCAGCIQDEDNPRVEPPKRILISSIPNEHGGRTVNLAITQLLADKAYGEAVITGDMAIVSLKNVADDQPFTGSGIGFAVGFTITGGAAAEVSYKLSSLLGKAITGEITAISWTEFDEQVPPQNPPQKKIIINEIPSTQSGNSITLTLLQSGTQKATASGAINGTSVTFNLTAIGNSQSFTGNGLFTVRFTTVASNVSVTYETVKLILDETTTIPWNAFGIKSVD